MLDVVVVVVALKSTVGCTQREHRAHIDMCKVYPICTRLKLELLVKRVLDFILSLSLF